MSAIVSRGPTPSLTDHPAFILMIQAALDRFHCTLGELREDYWLGRAWRALTTDANLGPRVARVGIKGVLIVAPGDQPLSPAERVRLRLQAEARILADTDHTADGLGLVIRFADGPVQTGDACFISLLAQVVRADPRWQSLGPYAADLAPVFLKVAFAAHEVVAA